MEKIVAFLMCVDAHFVLFCGPTLFEKRSFHLVPSKAFLLHYLYLEKRNFPVDSINGQMK